MWSIPNPNTSRLKANTWKFIVFFKEMDELLYIDNTVILYFKLMVCNCTNEEQIFWMALKTFVHWYREHLIEILVLKTKIIN